MLDCPNCSFPLFVGKKEVFCYGCDFMISFDQEKDLLRDITKEDIEDLLRGKTVDGLIALDLDKPKFINSKVTHLKEYND